MWAIRRFLSGVGKVLGGMVVLGLSLLPLTVLLVALPAISPNEAVLTETVAPTRSRWRLAMRRMGGLVAAFVVFVALFATALEIVSHLPLPERGQLGPLAQKVFGFALIDVLPLSDGPKREVVDGKAPLTPKELLTKKLQLERTLTARLDDPIRLKDAEEQLEEVNRQIQDLLYGLMDPATGYRGGPTSAKMKWLMDPAWGPWLGVPLWKILPTALVQHWPFVFLVMYILDLFLLGLIGKVPLAYNLRNIVVRWRIAGLTALAFTVVVALLLALLAFVNGMYQLNESSGVPGNVFVLSDGSTDELFSNLGYGDVDNIMGETVLVDALGMPLPKPVRVRQAIERPDGTLELLPPGQESLRRGAKYLASKEIYFSVSQPVEGRNGQPPRRRLLSMRALEDPVIAGAVHNITLRSGKWFDRTGVIEADTSMGRKKFIPCVVGEGLAGVLAEDANKTILDVGDTFRLGDMDWIVVGIMNAEGTTFGSELWVPNRDTITATFGKKGNYTTLVMRTDADALEAARAMAHHLQTRYTRQKLKAFAEPDYYAELTKTNDQFLVSIAMVAGVMAIGGIFGVMNTMFASIAARIREVGVLRILGFKRWQILISFMLESLLIAAIGGALGCALGYLANGFEARSQLSGGMGGGKGVTLKMIVDYQTIAAGMLFTLVMGRLGGLVPALSAMRMEILDSLR